MILFNLFSPFFPFPFVNQQDHGTRVQTTEYFIETANHLHGLNNLFSCCAITAAFLQSPIHRLKKIWKGKEVIIIFLHCFSDFFLLYFPFVFLVAC